MNIILCLFSCIIIAFSYLLPLCWFLSFRLNRKEKTVFFCLFLVSSFLETCHVENIGVVFQLISSCLYLYMLKKNYRRNICVFIAVYLSCVLWDNTCFLFWSTVPIPVSGLNNFYAYLIVGIPLRILLLAVIFSLSSKRTHCITFREYTEFSNHLLVSSVSNLMVCLFIFLSNGITRETAHYNGQIMIFSCALFGCYFILNAVLTNNIIKEEMNRTNAAIRQESYERLQEYTGQIENLYAALRSFKHDYLNIMLSMSGYIESEDIAGLKTYFAEKIIPLNNKMNSNTPSISQLRNIKISELKSIISAKLLYAIELNITVSIEVSEEISDIKMDIIDLTRIMGIYLDNAIEASLETSAPSIRFAIINLKKEYLFIIANSFLDHGIPYATLMQPNFSTKGDNRGIGLATAHDIISKYDSVFWKNEMLDSHFTQILRISK